MSTQPRIIERRFRGPNRSGHGGYSAGVVGVEAGNPSEVRLRRPPPIDRELALARDDDGTVRLLDGEEVVAEGRPVGPLGIDVPPPVLQADAAAGAAAALEKIGPPPYDHPFPECFGCGTARTAGDGLRIFAGPVPGRPGIFAAPWLPHESLAEPGTEVLPPVFVWAALDCPSGAPAMPFMPTGMGIVLGTMAADVRGLPRVGYRYALMSWLESETERALIGAAALLSETGDVLAVARGTWFIVDPSRFN